MEASASDLDNLVEVRARFSRHVRLLLLCKVEMRRYTHIILDTETRQWASAPNVQLVGLGQGEGVLMSSCKLRHVVNVRIKDRFANDIRDILKANAQLAAVILPPGIQLAVLVYGESVRMSAAHFFDQIVLEWDQKSWMQDFQTLHGAHLLICDKVLEAELSELIGAPRVE